MSAATRPWKSGFCVSSNPPDSHARCDEHPHREGKACACECHDVIDGDIYPGVVTPGIKPGLYYDLAEQEYHADPASLSVTGMKKLLKSPALYRYAQANPEHKDVFDFGSAAHKKVLGVGDPIAVIDADSWRTKAAQEAKAAAHAAGEIPLLAADAQRVDDMADALSGNTAAMRLLDDGQPEVSAFWDDPATGVRLRARFDYLRPRLVVDYKSAATADPADLPRTVVNFGYDMQAAQYLAAAEAHGLDAGRFFLIFQEKAAPYLTTVAELDADLIARGQRRVRAAIERYRDCQESGIWPGYTTSDFITITAPAWVRDDLEDAS